jgi:succinate-semialdehyde dehydrogenase / glutarate-semialdehyde dehydrogenase
MSSPGAETLARDPGRLEAGSALAVRDPRSGRVIGQVPEAGETELLAVARQSAQGFSLWSRVPVNERCAVLTRLADALARRPEELGWQFALETGKTAVEAEAELDRAADTLRWTAARAAAVTASRAIAAPDAIAREAIADPAGPVLAIIPANFPAVVLARKLGPALAMGCSVVVKAPESAPSVVLAICDLAIRAGLPRDALRAVVAGPAGTIALVVRPEFRVVTFTGSTPTGRLIAAAAAGTLASCVLELGGHAPAIIAPGTDLQAAVPALVRAKFAAAGQSCAAPSRFLVHTSLVAEFLCEFAAAVPHPDYERDEAGRPGTLGPLLTEGHQARVHALVRDALDKGARALTGGYLPQRPGYYYPATLLGDVPAGARVLREEPFGPVAPVVAFSSDDEAVTLANGTPCGLGAFVFGDPARADSLAARVSAGRVSVNCATAADPYSPLAGRGDSGYGYEGGDEGMLAFARLKVVHRPVMSSGGKHEV